MKSGDKNRVAIRVIFSPVRFGRTGLGVWFGPVRWFGLLVIRVVGSTRDYVDVVPLTARMYTGVLYTVHA